MTRPRLVSLGRLGLISLLAILICAPAWADSPRRVLRVSLYPYIPQAAAAALTLKQGFERDHPEVTVQISLNHSYYSLNPSDKGVLFEDADVHEIDVVLLGDFIAQHKLAPLSGDLIAHLDPLTPLAAQAATSDGTLVAVPQWMCTDFLIYRADLKGMAQARSLADLEKALTPDQGLLMDMTGADTLGELYLSYRLAHDGSAQAAVAHIPSKPEPEVVDRFRRILALEPAGVGRDPAYNVRGDFYARQFARRFGAAFVGYSEMTHEVLDETAAACRREERCVTADDIAVTAFPFADDAVRPAVWVDMFGIDARAPPQTRADAEAFIAYAVSLPAYRALLIPEAGEAPRYLLPATQAAFEDPQIVKAAPLYPKFRAIVDQGAVVRAPKLSARLHAVAAQIDAALPPSH